MSRQYAISKLVSIGRDIVEGRVRPLVGAIQLYNPVQTLRAEINPDSWALIVGVSSECDGLPLGSERQYWAPEALQEKDKRADAYETMVGPEIIQAARELLAQFSKQESMSSELETLDQLLGGELSLAIIRKLYPDDPTFERGVHALLAAGDVRLFDIVGKEVPSWRWRELFVEGLIMTQLNSFNLDITEVGAKKVI